MNDFVFAVTTSDRPGPLERCLRSALASTARPREICVVDNGGRFSPGADFHDPSCPIRVVRPGRNLGVAAGRNHIHELYASGDVVYSRDDIEVGPDVLGRLVECPSPFVAAAPGDLGCSLFLQREPAWERVGGYDEGFWPEGYEDEDYRRRMRLCGLEVYAIPGGPGAGLEGGEAGALASARLPWNALRYSRKWGGPPGGERFDRAWDGRRHCELAMYYDHVCSAEGDIRDHCPTLAALAGGCDHVTEMGSRSGVSTTALLYGQPRDLVCYDLDPRPELDVLFQLAGRTRLAIHAGDSLAAEIAETDLLFIDTFHEYEQAARELARHADKVRRYIALHDTTTFGEEGQVPGSRGLWPAIREFLESRRDWRLLARYHHNNGLTVLGRRGAIPA